MPEISQPETPLPQPLSLTEKQRVGLGIVGGSLAIFGLFSLLIQLQNGIATLAVVLSGGFCLLVATVGQLPGTMWTRFAREATDELQQLRALRSQLEEDEVMRVVAQVATVEGAQLVFEAHSQAFRWPAMVIKDEREVGVLYVADSSYLDFLPDIVEPDRSESAVLLIFGDNRTQKDRWSAVRGALSVGNRFDLTGATTPPYGPNAAETQLSVCGAGFAEVATHLDALVFDRIGGLQQSVEVLLVRPVTA